MTMARTRDVLLCLCLAALAVRGAWMSEPPGELRDYGSFVASGRAASQGADPYGIHPLTFHVVLPGFDVWNPNLNPPISVLAFQAFDLVAPERGLWLWRRLSLLFYVAALAVLAAQYGGGRRGLTILWALALAGFWDTLALGQIYLPLVAAAAASWVLLDRGRTVPAGLLMGIVVAVKPNFAVWPALLLLAGHGRAPLVAIGTALALWLAPIAVHGTEIYRQWLTMLAGDGERAAFLTNASLRGLTQRAGSAAAGSFLSLALLGALALWARLRRPTALEASAAGVIGAILASPIAWIHYTLFLLPLFFAARLTWPLAAAAALFVIPVDAILRLLEAPAWVQATAGSAYNWGVLLCLAGVFLTAAYSASPGRPRPARSGRVPWARAAAPGISARAGAAGAAAGSPGCP